MLGCCKAWLKIAEPTVSWNATVCNLAKFSKPKTELFVVATKSIISTVYVPRNLGPSLVYAVNPLVLPEVLVNEVRLITRRLIYFLKTMKQ